MYRTIYQIYVQMRNLQGTILCISTRESNTICVVQKLVYVTITLFTQRDTISGHTIIIFESITVITQKFQAIKMSIYQANMDLKLFNDDLNFNLFQVIYMWSITLYVGAQPDSTIINGRTISKVLQIKIEGYFRHQSIIGMKFTHIL